MAFCAMVKAAGALGGWTLLTAESAHARPRMRYSRGCSHVWIDPEFRSRVLLPSAS
jgi:hypothetical protein